MLSHRLTFGILMVAAFVLMLWLDEFLKLAPWFPFWLLAALVIFAALGVEMVGLLNQTGARPSNNAVLGGLLAVALANWAPHLTRHLSQAQEWMSYDPAGAVSALAWPLWAFVGVVMATFLAQSVQFVRPGTTVATIAGTVLAVAYIGLLGSFLIQFRWLPGPDHGIVAIAALVATAKGADTGAYTLGRLAGRHKLWPSLSPSKTIEGALGGLAFGVIASVIVAAVARLGLHLPALSWSAAVGFGLVVAAVAQLGDLMESMIKRDCLRKDASTTLPGFGGVLDVFDSLLFAAPVAYGSWLLLGPT